MVMDVYQILLCLVTGILSQFNNSTPEEKAICGDTYFFLHEEYNYVDSIQRCQDLGYDGLAVIIRTEQRDQVYDMFRTENVTKNKGFLLAYEFRGPNPLDWGWKRDGAWLKLSEQYAPEWNTNLSEPDAMPGQSCTNFRYDNGGLVWWKSNKCSNLYFGLCQKQELGLPSYRESKMKVYLSNRREPNGTEVKVNSVIECLLLCLDQCTCTFTYHYGSTCFVITGNDGVNGESGMGAYYKKVY